MLARRYALLQRRHRRQDWAAVASLVLRLAPPGVEFRGTAQGIWAAGCAQDVGRGCAASVAVEMGARSAGQRKGGRGADCNNTTGAAHVCVITLRAGGCPTLAVGLPPATHKRLPTPRELPPRGCRGLITWGVASRGRPQVGSQAQQVAEHAARRHLCARARPPHDQRLLRLVPASRGAGRAGGGGVKWVQTSASRNPGGNKHQ